VASSTIASSHAVLVESTAKGYPIWLTKTARRTRGVVRLTVSTRRLNVLVL
jgi:hypothetical protein